MFYRINHEIFSVDFHNNDVITMITTGDFSTTRVHAPIVSIKDNNGNIQLYLLSLELEYWVLSCMRAASTGENPFPYKVAFGIIDNKVHVEFR
ncbi:hypothetical protein [Bacillus cereus]|uniref:hypothetical protein n=1 Tax=Bacillus cereus TaxID=1396 RepID=UPI000BF383F7|nr:hypothetical protein [Bacillus cereus]PEQ97745.1 hypothetical protein CN477_27965 [Bacillus cereus]PFK19338.1 hypothetical protein COJ03_23525 [Bacillus cereus]PFN26731.1 hypothetical protein COJ69_00630 [Bacillus cereus]